MYGLAMGGGFNLGTMGICVRVGGKGECILQRNKEGSTLCRSSVHMQPPFKWNTITGLRVGQLHAVAVYAFEWWRGQRLSALLLGQGAIKDAGIEWLLQVANGGCGIVNGLVIELFQVWVLDDLMRGLQMMMPNIENQTNPKGRRERKQVIINMHLRHIYTNGTPWTISNKFTIFCMSVQISIQIIFGIHVSLACWVKIYKLWHE